jgi:tellurite resistance protein
MDRFFSYLRWLNTGLDVDAVEAFVWGNEMVVGVGLGVVGFLLFYIALRFALCLPVGNNRLVRRRSSKPAATPVDDKLSTTIASLAEHFAAQGEEAMSEVPQESPQDIVIKNAMECLASACRAIADLSVKCVESSRSHHESSADRMKDLATAAIESIAEMNRRCADKFETMHERSTIAMQHLVDSLTDLGDDDDE